MRLRTVTILAFVFIAALAVSGRAVEPITGAAFDSLIAAQETLHQRETDSLVGTLSAEQQDRYLIWLRHVENDGWQELADSTRTKYEQSVNQYLMSLGSDSTLDPPEAGEHGVPERFDLFPESPDYVIPGYQNYKDFLNAYVELTTEFASGITAFVPTAATLDRMKANAPREAYPNKEAIILQEEYRQFFERGGDLRMIQTLTRSGFDNLKSGEYTFAVGLNGTIRFARETHPDEVERIKRETGHAPPRINHAFLFSGDAVLTAGIFFVDERVDQKLVKVNTQTGHYFYSNINKSIREDIAVRSDHYLLTLGHFFIELDRIGVSYDGILVSKF